MATNKQDELDRILSDLEADAIKASITVDIPINPANDVSHAKAKAAIEALIAHHMQEAELKARIDERELVLKFPKEHAYQISLNRIDKLKAELSAPQQSTSPDGSAG